MVNFQILANDDFLFFFYLNLKQLYLFLLILFDPSNYKNLKIKSNYILNNNNSCNNNFKYCFNQLYYDCKHLIVLIIVECRLTLLGKSVTWVSGSIIILY